MSASSSGGPPRVFLHVGSPKTGTTFLQQLLWAQRDVAAGQGVHLPLDQFNDHYQASLDVRGLAGKPPHPPESAGAWNRLVSETLNLHGTALISHELFAAADQEQARKAVGWFGTGVEVHVVITARDLVRQVKAEWQEHVKHRSRVGLAEFVSGLRDKAPGRKGWFWLVQDYADVAARWGSRLPAERVHVVTVPPSGSPGDLLWHRFAGLVGLDPAAFDLGGLRSNTSLGREQAELLRRVNAALGERLPVPGVAYPTIVKDVLAHRLLAARTGTRLALTATDTEFVLGESRRIADTLGESGVDIVGSLDDLTPDPEEALAAASDQAYAEVSRDALLEESIAALADLLEVVAERQQEQRHQAEVVESLQRSPLKAALNQASEGRPAIGRARDVYRRLRKDAPQ